MSVFKLLNPLRWRKSFLIAVLVSFGILWFGFLDTYSIYTRYKLHAEREQLQHKIEQLKVETAQLQSKIDELKANPDLLEKIAREQYGMRRDGEKIYRIIEE
jgi:cell division protein FtsB